MGYSEKKWNMFRAISAQALWQGAWVTAGQAVLGRHRGRTPQVNHYTRSRVFPPWGSRGCQPGGVKGGPAPTPDPPAPYQGQGRASPSQRGQHLPGLCSPAAGFSVAMGTVETLFVFSALFLLPAEAQQGRALTSGVVGWGGAHHLLIFNNEKPRTQRGCKQKRKGSLALQAELLLLH